jgi:hypothetical protein
MPSSPDSGPRPAPLDGYRALFRGESERPSGKQRFRLAVALRPPDRLRLEVYGPGGSPRLVAASSGASLLALLPAEAAYDRLAANAEEFDRILGIPVDGAGLIALLTARPLCSSETARFEVATRSAATLGRTLAWYEVSCPPGEIRYQGQARERGGSVVHATIRDGISGAMILQVEYDDFEERTGTGWPRKIHLRLARDGGALTLEAAEGPHRSDIPEEVFEPLVPEAFERRPLSAPLTSPGRSHSTAEPEE